MGELNGSYKDKMIQKNYDRTGPGKISNILFFIAFCLLFPSAVQSAEKARVAVLPFSIHSLKPLDHLIEGLQEMMTARIVGKGLRVINPNIVNKHPRAFKPFLEEKELSEIGKDLKTDWIIMGSLTQVGVKISLDLKIVDTTRVKLPFSIFMVEDDLDRLSAAVDRAVASIYNKIAGVIQIDLVRVKGNRRIESDAILALVESKKGDELDKDRLDKDLRAIYKMGFFKDVKIDTEEGPGGKVVVFNVVEKPSISRISFQGNKKIKEKELNEESGIKRYSILNRNEIRQSINRLKEYYHQKGYYGVEITETIEELPNNEVSLTYNIKEGDKVYVTKIQFIGNNTFKDDDLKDIMETSEKGFFHRVTLSGLLDKKKLEYDTHKITSFYYNHGYIKARTGVPQISLEEGKGITITIEIIEGKQYTVNDVRIEGELMKSEEELLGMISIQKKKFFSREVILNDVKDLRNIYVDLGYAHAEVVPVTKEDDKNYLVDITYKISKGKRVRLERIHITGNSITRDKVIRRELKIVEGDFFSGKHLRRSALNLNRLGFFEDVEIKTKKGSRDDLMTMDIEVKERATGLLSIGAGYSSFDKTTAIFQIAQNNLFGKGQKLSAHGRIGTRTNEFNIKFTEPWLFDIPLSAGIDLIKWKTEFDEYTKDSTGGALRFGFPLSEDEFTRGSVGYRYDDAEITDIDDNAASTIKEMAGRNITSSVKLGLSRDTKDKPWNTTKGSLNSISFEYAGGFLGGDVYFNKYEARSAWYYPLWWKTVFMIQGRLGLVKQRAGGKLPIYEKFFLGGINTVRGYDYASISPRDPLTGDKIGGEKEWVYNLEYRFPFPYASEQGVVGLVFFDAGNVFREEDDFEFKARRSIGAGIRWYSPIGPLRFEYGFKLDRRPDESSGGMEFSVGGTF